MSTVPLLHGANLRRVPLVGELALGMLAKRVAEVGDLSGVDAKRSISIVIRSRNNVASLNALFDDIDRQDFAGELEVIVVDSDSSDGSKQLARQRGATVVDMDQANYSHPKALNYGFRAANHDWVLSLVEHSLLAHRLTLRAATRWSAVDKVAGACGMGLPNDNASLTERVALTPVLLGVLCRPARPVHKGGLGILATNCSTIRRDVWSDLGGFDERYGAGGEDGAFCRAALATGYKIFLDPALSVYHSHGLGPAATLQQGWDWTHMGKPREFSLERLLKYRTDLRQRERRANDKSTS